MKRGLIVVGIILLVLVGLRLALDPILEQYIHKAFNNIEGYQGNVEDVDLTFYKGNYQVKGINIQQSIEDSWQPFIKVDSVDISIQWEDLMEGEIVGKVLLYQPVVTIIQQKAPEKVKRDQYWGKKLEDMLPFKIKEFEIVDGRINYQNPTQQPPVDVHLQDIYLVAMELTNMHDTSVALPATLSASATSVGNGQLELDLQMDMIDKIPAFQADLKLTSVDLTQLNDFIKAYGHFDVKEGSFSLMSEIEVEDRQVSGYVKPIFKNLDVFSLQQDSLKNVGQTGWEALLGLGAELFENQEKDQIATKVPIEGTLQATQVNMGAAILNTFQNAFQDAIDKELSEEG